MVHLEIQGLIVGVGDQDHLLFESAHIVEKGFAVRMHFDEVPDALFQGRDVQSQFPGPKIDVGPVQGSLFPFVPGKQLLAGLGQVISRRRAYS